ncbi:Peroxidase [Sarcoptes scabiei]|nr:Peroxidase [Sarcoptes scabiei]
MSLMPLIYRYQNCFKSLEQSNSIVDDILQQMIKIRTKFDQSNEKNEDSNNEQIDYDEDRPKTSSQLMIVKNEMEIDPRRETHRLNDNNDGGGCGCEENRIMIANERNVIDSDANDAEDNNNDDGQTYSTIIIDTIQKESNPVSKLQNYNTFLRQQLKEYQFVLELIMSKYRQKIFELLNESDLNNRNILSRHSERIRLNRQTNIIATTDTIEDLIRLFKSNVCSLNETIMFNRREHLQRLLIEYHGLKELVKISNDFGSFPSAAQKSRLKVNETLK